MSPFMDKIYSALPAWGQNIGMSVYGVIWRQRRFGGVFNRELQEYLKHEQWSKEHWQEYEVKQLQHLLTQAYAHVPYYQRLFDKIGIPREKLNQFKLDELKHIPLLSKEIIKSNQDSLFSNDYQSIKKYAYHTSGTTGTPLAIYFTSQMHQQWSAAYEARCRQWAKVDHQMRRAMIGGRLVVSKGNAKPPFWRHNWAERQIYFSAFHISPTNTPDYVRALNQYKPDYLVGYAAACFFLARMIDELGLQVPQMKAVLTSSEKLTPSMREVLKRVFKCEVFDAYSGVEACCLASECEYHRLHVSPDVGHIEILDEKGNLVPSGVVGEIVATGFLNYAQPLIRYQTGDLASWSDEKCPCGREMPILKELVGRLEDTVIGQDGREMVRFHGIFVGLESIQEGQVIQESFNRFTVKAISKTGVSDKDRSLIQKRFEERLGPVEVDILRVDQIERTERGKFRAVISKVRRSAQRTTL